MLSNDDAIRSRLIQHSTGPIELAPRPDAIPDTSREIDVRLPFMPGLPQGFDEADGQLSRAHSGAHERAREIRRIADQAWRDEPRVNGVQLTPAQKLAWRREHVRSVVASELEKAGSLLRPIVERSRKALEAQRGKLVEKGTPRLDGVPASRAMAIANHIATLPAEIRALRISEALQQPNEPDARELLTSLAWAPRALDLAAPEMIDLVKATLIASADPQAYEALTQLDTAIQATSESLDNLEKWGLSLADEN